MHFLSHKPMPQSGITKKRTKASVKAAHANPTPTLPPQTWDEVEREGARPSKPAELYIVQGRGVYNIRVDQIASLRPTETKEQAEYARSAAGRVPLCINAGTPTDKNPEAGACFHGHEYDPKPCETSEVEWYNSRGMWLPKEIAQNWCSQADVIARYAGGEALKEAGAALFQTCFLNDGSSEWASSPQEGECDKAWTHQRSVIEANLSKLFVVCPFAPIEPDLIAEGYPIFADDSAGPGWKGSEALTWDYGRPILLACLVTIASDKSEAARARGTGGNIGGYHDRCRLHLLPSAHVAKILEMAAHFDLLEQFPILGHQGLCENAGAPLERWRQKAIDAVGLPPNGRMTDEWLQKRAQMICGVPWVQRCSAEWPGGELDEQGQPVLVPLTRYGAEMRNGSSWLYLEEYEQGTKRYEQIRTALANIIGRRAPPKPLPQSPEVSAIVQRLRGELEIAKEHIEALKKRNGELEQAVAAIQSAIEPLKR